MGKEEERTETMGSQLIIIGNGFDLECGLKSSYGDFFKHLADKSPTTRNTKDNIWNHIFKFLHDANLVVRFFHDNKYLLNNDEWIRNLVAKIDSTPVQVPSDEQIQKDCDKQVHNNFNKWVRENFDEQTKKEFANQREEILSAWKQANFDDWEQKDPDSWKDVESVIRDWTTGILTAPNRDIGTTDALKDIQWIIERLLSDDINNIAVTSLIRRLLDNPDETSSSNPLVWVKRVHDLLRRYSIPLKELLNWVRGKQIVPRTSVADILLPELTTFESEFMDYMRSEAWYNPRYQQRARRLYRLISSTDAPSPVNDYVLSFNYTRPNTAGFTGIRCWRNVHGSLEDGNAIFGFDITDLQPEQRKSHDLIRFTKTYRVLQLPQNPTGQPKLLEPVTGGGSFGAIKVYGHSLDRADYSYFKAIFDCVDLYSSNVKLFFFYPANREDIGAGLYQSVSDLLTDYGDEMPDRGKGRNLMHRLLLQDRLSVIPLDTSTIK